MRGKAEAWVRVGVPALENEYRYSSIRKGREQTFFSASTRVLHYPPEHDMHEE